MRKITKRSAAVIGATVVAIGGGAAWAASSWFEGTGSAEAATSEVKTVTATAVIADKLYPGKSATAVVTATNPNDYPVTITGTSDLVVTVNKGAGCELKRDDLVLSSPPANTIPAAANGSNGTLTGDWANFITMGPAVSPKCAGTTFELTFELAGEVAS